MTRSGGTAVRRSNETLGISPSSIRRLRRQRQTESLATMRALTCIKGVEPLREAGFAPEGLAAVGRKNPLAGPVRGDVDETVKTSPESEMAHQRLPEWLRNPRISREVGIYCGLGRCRGWKPHPSNESSPRSSQPMLLATAPSWGEMRSALFAPSQLTGSSSIG